MMKRTITIAIMFFLPFASASEDSYTALGCTINLKSGYKITNHPKEKRTVIVSPKDGALIEIGSLPYPNAQELKTIKKEIHKKLTISKLSNNHPKEPFNVTLVENTEQYMAFFPTRRNKGFTDKVISLCLDSEVQN